MIEHLEMLISKLRFIFVGVLMIASVLLLLQIFSAARTIGSRDSTAHAEAASAPATTQKAKAYGNPNVVAIGMSNMADTFAKSLNTTERALVGTFGSAFRSVASVSKSAADGVADGTKFAALGAYKGVSFAARGAGNGIVFVAQLPVKAMGLVTEAPGVRTLIRPDDATSMPEIDSQLLALYPEQPEAAKQEPAPVEPQIDATAMWPIHGRITTKFGVPHWPYQKTHTGMDISSGTRSGVTAVKPFKPGQVMKVVYSKVGLGNHVVVDHGGGLTSVYAHLYSISVKEKQPVDKSTTLGLEGSTGASTGTHLHFEIRLNGQVVDPRQYISGQP